MMNITCPTCLTRLAACPTNERGFRLADRVYAVGNSAHDAMGHAMYFSATGRVALCIAERLEVTT